MIEPCNDEVPRAANRRLRKLSGPAEAGPVPATAPGGTTTETPLVAPPIFDSTPAWVAVGPAMTGTLHPSAARADSTEATAPESSRTTSTLGWVARTCPRAADAPLPDGDTVARPVMVKPSPEDTEAKWAAPCRLGTSLVITRATDVTFSFFSALPMTKAWDSIEAVIGYVLGKPFGTNVLCRVDRLISGTASCPR